MRSEREIDRQVEDLQSKETGKNKKHEGEPWKMRGLVSGI